MKVHMWDGVGTLGASVQPKMTKPLHTAGVDRSTHQVGRETSPLLAMTSRIQQIPPAHRGGYDLETAELTATSDKYGCW
jgi:hypothetical protein